MFMVLTMSMRLLRVDMVAILIWIKDILNDKTICEEFCLWKNSLEKAWGVIAISAVIIHTHQRDSLADTN